MDEEIDPASSDLDEEKIKKLAFEFTSKRSEFEEFTGKIKNIIEELIKINKIEVDHMEKRTKELNSFEGKIKRPEKANKYSCCEDITDLSGVRIIFYLREDVECIVKIIKDNFKIDEENSKKRSEFTISDRLGYAAEHLVVSLSPDRLSLPENLKFTKFKAEIQIKTVLEHAWAAIDWKLRYKGDRNIPPEILRRLYIISGTLEGADDAFSAVNYESKKLIASYKENIEKGNSFISINRESITVMLEKSKVVQEFAEFAANLKIRVKSVSEEYQPETAFIISIAYHIGITDITGIENRLKIALADKQKIFEALNRATGRESGGGDSYLRPQVDAMVGIILITSSSEAEFSNIMSKTGLGPKAKKLYEDIRKFYKS